MAKTRRVSTGAKKHGIEGRKQRERCRGGRRRRNDTRDLRKRRVHLKPCGSCFVFLERDVFGSESRVFPNVSLKRCRFKIPTLRSTKHVAFARIFPATRTNPLARSLTGTGLGAHGGYLPWTWTASWGEPCHASPRENSSDSPFLSPSKHQTGSTSDPHEDGTKLTDSEPCVLQF